MLIKKQVKKSDFEKTEIKINEKALKKSRAFDIKKEKNYSSFIV
jgi:hypothetical protein